MEKLDRLKPRYDVAIVGAGHNGLVAANYLAMAGLSVIVLEQKPHFGGASISSRIFPDYEALISRYAYLVSLLPQQILDDLQINFTTRRRRTASFTPYVNADGEPVGVLMSNEDSECSRQSFMTKVGRHQDWSRYQEFLELESAIADAVWPTLTQPLESRATFQRMLDTDKKREAWKWFVERPLGQGIEYFIDDDLIRGLVMTDAKIGVFTNPYDESLIQNRCFLYHVIGRGTGEWQVPVGGMGGLIAALTMAAQKRGVAMMASTSVVQLSVGSHCHTIHLEQTNLDSEPQRASFDATRVLFNASPKRIAHILKKNWLPTATDEGSVVKVNMLLRKLPRLRCTSVQSEEAFAGSLHINEGYQQMLTSFEEAKNGRVPSPAPCEIYCHTLTDPSILSADLQQRGFHTITLFGLDAPYRLFTTETNIEVRNRFLQSYLDELDSLCEDSFRDCLALDSNGEPCIEAKSALDLEEEVGLDQGNIFHNSLSWFFAEDVSNVGLWGVETEYERIYICGSSARRGGAVSGIPGHNAAMKIFAELGIGK